VNKLFAFVLCVAIAGCIPMSHHSGSDLSKLPEFRIEKGTTTEAELMKTFGEPQTTMTNGDGTRTLMWSDNRANGHINVGSAFVPGVKTADQKTQSRSLTVTTRKAVVVDYRVTDHQGDASF
jgi:hypothetical protein